MFGLILRGLKRRRKAGTAAFTVMSCDNIPHNGEVTAGSLVGLARLADDGLADWIENHVAFPNGMVDRITPATTDRERRLLADRFGIEDASPVFCEPFRQWVLEDRFAAGRPALEAAGVQFVDDVQPFELMKIRILNGGHAAIAYPAGLLGIDFVHEAMAEPLVSGLSRKAGEGGNHSDRAACARRGPRGLFPADRPALLQSDDRRHRPPPLPRRLQPAAEIHRPDDRRPAEAGNGIDGLALESALWCRYCFGTTEDGSAIEPNDPDWTRLQATARAARADPAAWLAMADIYGDVGQSPAVFGSLRHGSRRALGDGVGPTLARYLAAGA